PAAPAAPAPGEGMTPAPEQEEALSFIRLLYNTLLENEVDERYANELTDELEKGSKPNTSLDYALANVYQKMVLKFGMPQTIPPIEDNAPRAEIFIGPTGVGKTTTIAKLASKLHLQEKKKVALLTIDTYRIAAAEQLRTYASIMETPFRVIYSVEEMKQAIDDFRDYDYLMVDTAGHSLHNEEQKENIAQFIRAIAEEMDCDNYLVLSATTKYRDLTEIADTYATMVDYRLIFTKMDETHATGNLYNIRMHTGAPMSYITNGQDVPDDIEVFNAQKIVKGLLGGRK
ncbi:MAG: 50S ribosome-binding GTPase, partial [Lachnospiraceae bacterium]|nr:50S ribosome-binding GTPase [Lachnospiraceae bacterium]